MKIFTTIFLLFLYMFIIGNPANAQVTYGGLTGNVKSIDGKPAAYVSVGLLKTNRGATTNEKGYYELRNIKAGSYILKISSVGLKTEEYAVTIVAGKTAQQDVKLKESAAQLREVSITSSKTMNKPVSLGKSDIKPLNLPQSTGVISSTVIADQQAIRLGDVVKNVSGVSLTQNRGGVAETFSARGYSIGIAGAAGSIFKNGVISNTMGFPDASTLESIEVLKGSSALLYGNVSGGVIINMVTKKPRFEWGGEASILTGSYGEFKPVLDVYGPISKNLAFRIIGTHEDANSYRDVVNTHRNYITPSLEYKIGQKTDILLQADYLQSDIVPDAGVGVPNSRITLTSVPEQPRNRFINTSWAYNDTHQASGFLTINHRFNNYWRLTAVTSSQETNVRGFGVGVPMAILANGNWARSLSAVRSKENDYTSQLNLNGEFKTGKINHQILVGTDYTSIKTTNYTFNYTNAAGVGITAYDVINIFDPATINVRTDVPNINNVSKTVAPQDRFGVFAQDLISLTPKFKVLAGLRWSYQNVFQTSIRNFVTGINSLGTGLSKADKAFSPKVALIYQPIETSSIYATYSNNFTINTGTDIYGDNLKPSIIDQYEIGLKNNFLNGRLSANLSVYRIINSNFAQTALFDINGNPNTNTSIKTLNGQTTSDGLEVDVNGTLSKNFYFILGYGYNNARYTNTTGITGSQVEGERLINNPANTVNSSIFYTLSQSKLKGLKFGASAFYTGKRFGGNNNVTGAKDGELNSTATTVKGVTTYTSSYNTLLPLTDFTTVDLSAGYSYHKISLLTKVSNVFNTFNYIVHDRYSLNPIPPRMFIATLGYRF